MATQPIDVLVIGAGPVGLTTAIELTRRGIPCRVVDRRPTPRPGSRACTVWQRTLETFDLMGLPVDDYVASGSRYVYRTYHLTGFPPFTHDMSEQGSPHPDAVIIAQTETERMLTEHLAGLGVVPERGLKAVALQQDPDGVTVTLQDLDGGSQTVRAGYVVAAQGPHSTVRDQAGIDWISKRFPGTQLLQVDARLHGELPGDPTHCHLFMNHLGSLGTAPFPDGRLRLYAGVPDLDPDRSGDPEPEQVLAAVRLVTGLPELTLSDARFNWRVRLHNSIAANYRAGRCFLAGDSAHTTMPVTAQGMNTGIQDAFNLAWKLAAVVTGAAGESLLDSYDAERRPIALGLLQRTERAYWGGVGQLPDWPDLYEKLHRISSTHTGIPLSYADGPLADDRLGSAGGVRPGERVPDGPLGTDRLFRLLGSGSWTLLAFPTDPADPASVEKAARAVSESGVSGHVVRQEDDAVRQALGASVGGLYLARPDGYLGYRGPVDDTSALRTYVARLAA